MGQAAAAATCLRIVSSKCCRRKLTGSALTKNPKDTTSCEMALPSLSRRGSLGAERRFGVELGAAGACQPPNGSWFGLWAGREARFRANGCPSTSGGRGGRLYRVASMKPDLGSERLRGGAPGSEFLKVPAGTDEPICGRMSGGGPVSAIPTGAGIEESPRGYDPETSFLGGSELRLPTPSKGAT